MKVQVLASGSKGNCTYIESDDTRILIDVGINYLRIKLNSVFSGPQRTSWV